MKKVYQVFVSSTYLDLIDERKAIIETLINNNCIPRGMEMFPAKNEKLLDTIKAVIDECDYYVLVIGGKYGSIDLSSHLSYTELEYDYAFNSNIPILPFIPAHPEKIEVGKSEIDILRKEKLCLFIDKVKNNNCPQYWSDVNSLVGKVISSITAAISDKPRPGLVKGMVQCNDSNMYAGDVKSFYDQNNAKLLACINRGIYDEYLSRNILITPCIDDECFNIRSNWKFKSISIHGNPPEFSFNHSSTFPEFLANFRLISYKINGKECTQASQQKLITKFDHESKRYYVSFSDQLALDDKNSAEVECIYEFKVSLPEYNSYSSYMYPAKSRDVKITVEGKDSGGWVLKANSFTSFRNLGYNYNALWSARDNYIECKSDNSYNLNIKEWTLPGTGFAFTISKREHTTQCWKPKKKYSLNN